MQQNPLWHYRPVGFADDDRRLPGVRIHAVTVLGDRHDIPHVPGPQIDLSRPRSRRLPAGRATSSARASAASPCGRCLGLRDSCTARRPRSCG
jgi:hypothetical protein